MTMKRNLFFFGFPLSLFLLMTLSACNHDPLFDQLAENRIVMFMKGTYSSNGPKSFTAFPAGETNANALDDSRTTVDSRLDLSDLEIIKLDLSQVSMINTSKDDFDINEDDVQKLSDERQLFFFKFMENPTFTKEELYNKYDLEDPNLSDTEIQNKISLVTQQNLEFFKGQGYGVHYHGGDIASGTYNKFRIFIRKIVTGQAKSYLLQEDGVTLYSDPWTTTTEFDNDTEDSYEISQFYRYLPTEVGGSQTRNYLFPLTLTRSVQIPSKDPVHIEFRIFIKNNMRSYQASDYSGLFNARFWAFSDFKENYDNSVNRSMYMSFPATFRVYNPFNVGTIQGNLGATYTSSGDLTADRYVVAVQTGTAPPTNFVSELATGSAAGSVYNLTNVAPGTYDVYIMRDVTNSAGVSTPDGFPETVEVGPVTVTVTKDQTATANIP